MFLIGEISKSPRWHKNSQDGAVLCFTLISRETHQQRGVPVEQTEEHTIKIPENRFDQELKLGQLVCIEGKLKTTSFVDEHAIRRYRTEVIVIRANVLR